MEQLPLTFNFKEKPAGVQAEFTPAFSFSKLNSSNGTLYFTANEVWWYPDEPIALLDQGWSLNVNEIVDVRKFGLAGLTFTLVDGKKLNFANVGKKMLAGITEAVNSRKDASWTPPASQPAAQAAAAQVASAQSDGVEAFEESDVKGHKFMALLSYLCILVLIPLVAARDSKFVRFHINQGLILLICEVVVCFIGLAEGLKALVTLLDILIGLLALIGIINVLKGVAKPLPFIGKFRIIK